MNPWLCFVLSILASSSLQILAQNKQCPKLTLKNGRVRLRGNGRMAYFRCKKKFQRVGQKLAVCLSSGTWSQQSPVCVGQGCPDLGALVDVTVTELYKGGILQFTCPKGMRRQGPQTLMCDGTAWDGKPPKCLYGVSLGCDFEDPALCGWSQDTNDDFDWTWTSGVTPTMETGPEGDHTTGSGHYIFMESSAPQKAGDVARLISPPYHPTSDNICLDFFYHMKGPVKKNEVGDLDVLIRTEKNNASRDVNVFHKDSYQGDDWIKGHVVIPHQNDFYRIVFAAIRRESWTGDIALDDIRVFNCSEINEAPKTEAARSPWTTATASATESTSFGTTILTSTSPETWTKLIFSPSSKSTTSSAFTTSLTSVTAPTSPTTPTTRLKGPSSRTIIPSMTTSATTSTLTSTDMSYTTWLRKESTTHSDVYMTSSTVTRATSYPVKDTASTRVTRQDSTQISPYSPYVTFTSSPTQSGSLTTLSTSAPRPTSTSAPRPTSTSAPRPTSTSAPRPTSTSASRTSTSSSTPDKISNTSVTQSDKDTIGSADIQADVGTTHPDTQTNVDTTHPDTQTNVDTTHADSQGAANPQPSTGSGSTVSDYLPLIVGVSLGLAVGTAVVGVLAWLWARNRRKQKELQEEEDQLDIMGSIEGNSCSYPPSHGHFNH